jgi:hypothetical protein
MDQRRLAQLFVALRTGRPQVTAPAAAPRRPDAAATAAATPSASSSAALEGWSAAAEDHAFLDRMGWRCEGQLAYLADELESRGEAVNAMSLHEEGLRQGVKLLKTGNNP